MNSLLTYILFGLITFLIGKIYGKYEYKKILRSMQPTELDRKELTKKIDEAFEKVVKQKAKKPVKTVTLSESFTKRFTEIDAKAMKLKEYDEALTKKVDKLWEDVRKKYELKDGQALTVSDDYKAVHVLNEVK